MVKWIRTRQKQRTKPGIWLIVTMIFASFILVSCPDPHGMRAADILRKSSINVTPTPITVTNNQLDFNIKIETYSHRSFKYVTLEYILLLESGSNQQGLDTLILDHQIKSKWQSHYIDLDINARLKEPLDKDYGQIMLLTRAIHRNGNSKDFQRMHLAQVNAE